MKTTVSRRAFSIIEIMAALLVLVVGIFSAAELFTQAYRSAAITDTQIVGNSLAQLKLEELGAAESQLRSMAGASGSVQIPASGVGTFEQNPGYSWQAAVVSSSSHLSIDVAVYRAGLPQPVAKASGIRLAKRSRIAEGAK